MVEFGHERPGWVEGVPPLAVGVLSARGLGIDAAREAEIKSCRDVAVLEARPAQAAVVASASDLVG